MNLSTDDARAVLRALDPAAGMQPSSAEQVDAAWRALTTAPAPAQDPMTDRSGGRAMRTALVAACIVAVVAVAVAVAAIRGTAGHRSTAATNGATTTAPKTQPVGRPSSGGPSSATPPPGTAFLPAAKDPHYLAAAAQVHLVAQRLPVLPRARQVGTSPVAALTGPGPSTYTVTDSLFWTAPWSVDYAISYFTDNPPPVADATPQVAYASPADASGISTLAYYGSPTVTFSAAPYRNGVAVRVDVEGNWAPTKPAGLYLGTVDSVDVVVDRPPLNAGATHAPTVVRTLTGSAAQRLAAAVDAAQPDPVRESMSCPYSAPFTDRLVFHIGSRTATAVDAVQACSRLDLSVSGTTVLLNPGNVDSLLMTLLGLPQDYGH